MGFGRSNSSEWLFPSSTRTRSDGAWRTGCVVRQMRPGKLLTAREHLEQAVALYDPERHGSTAFIFGQDLGVSALAHLTWVLWLLGYLDRALHRQAEGLALAHRVGHKNKLGFALMYSAMVGAFGRNARSAAEHAATLLELAREHKLDLWAASAGLRGSFCRIVR
jgi:hypothetical protein